MATDLAKVQSGDSTKKNGPDPLVERRTGSIIETNLWTDDEEKKVVRKIDWRLMPLMTVAYMLQFLDKITLNNASIMGIREDLHLTGLQYSWANSIFYFGYLIAAYPGSIAMTKFPISKLISISIIIWGVILALHAVSGSFAGLAVLRFLLGVFESVISPGFSIIVSIWYKQGEHASRHSIWFAGNAAGSFFGSFISFGVAHVTGFSAWRALFILYGGLTFVWGGVLLLFLPDAPTTAKFLTSQEKEIAAGRVSSFQLDTKRQYNMAEVREACRDPQTWLIAGYSLLICFGNGALTAFGNIVTKGFGFSTFATLLLQLPSAVTTTILVLLTGWLAGRFKQIRAWLIIGLLVLGMVGAIMVRQITASNKVARLIGMILFAKFTCAMPLVMSMIASNVGGQTKKAFVSAVFFIAYCAGNIAGPQVFIQSEAPAYPTAFATMISTVGMSAILILILRILLVRRNKIRNEKYGVPPEESKIGSDLAHLTDLQRERTYRYHY